MHPGYLALFQATCVGNDRGVLNCQSLSRGLLHTNSDLRRLKPISTFPPPMLFSAVLMQRRFSAVPMPIHSPFHLSGARSKATEI
jgi:hypothetical protein